MYDDTRWMMLTSSWGRTLIAALNIFIVLLSLGGAAWGTLYIKDHWWGELPLVNTPALAPWSPWILGFLLFILLNLVLRQLSVTLLYPVIEFFYSVSNVGDAMKRSGRRRRRRGGSTRQDVRYAPPYEQEDF